jgi:ankyrin repeat protein
MKIFIRSFIVFCVFVCAAATVYLFGPDGPRFKPVLAAADKGVMYLSILAGNAAAGRQSAEQRLVFMPRLMQAVKENDLRTANALLMRGTSANALGNATSETPLFEAIKNNNPQMAALLLAHGANPYQVTETGQMPVHAAVQENILGEGEDYKGTEIIQLLLARGVGINQRDLDGQTALMCACKSHKPRTAAWLLARGADTAALDNAGRTALDIARQSDSLECLELLENYGDGMAQAAAAIQSEEEKND